MSRLSDTLNTFEDCDLTFLGEPVQVAAKVKDGFRTGVIALTETSLVFLRKNKGETIIHRATDRNTITDLTYKRSWGQWRLEFRDGSKFVSYLENGDDFESFVAPLAQNAEHNASHMIDGYDLRVVGERPLLVAKLIDASGILVLTDDHLVYLRKNGKTYVDRESHLSMITDVKYSKSLGDWWLEFNDGPKTVSYYIKSDDIEAFVEPLRRSAEENRVNRSETEAKELEYIVGEPIKHICKTKASDDRVCGTIALTRTRLVFLRSNNGTPTVKHQTALNAITKARLVKKDGLNVLHLRAGIWYISYQSINQHSEALSPIFKALVPIAEHNEKILAHSIAEAEARHREEAAKRESEKRARAEAQTTRPESLANTKPIPIGELKKLAELMDLGIVTEDEFELKKNQILGIQQDPPNQIHHPEMDRRRANRTAYGGRRSKTGGWGWKRWGCTSVVVLVVLLLLLMVCTPSNRYDCEREGDSEFTWDAGGVDDVLEYMERCP